MNPQIIAEIVDRGKEDWLDFAEVMFIVRSHQLVDESAAIALSIELVRDMLNRNLVKVGELQKRGDAVCFAPWDGQPKQIAERIQHDLASLGHRPGIGDVCWLSTI
jgi:hypothetical protein